MVLIKNIEKFCEDFNLVIKYMIVSQHKGVMKMTNGFTMPLLEIDILEKGIWKVELIHGFKFHGLEAIVAWIILFVKFLTMLGNRVYNRAYYYLLTTPPATRMTFWAISQMS